MQNKKIKLNTILLMVIIVLLGVGFWFLSRLIHLDPMDMTGKSVVIPLPPSGQIETKDNADQPDYQPQSSTPESRKITFLKGLITARPNPFALEIRECDNAGTDVIAVTYDGGGAADEGWTIYETNTEEVVDHCGGFTSVQPPANSFCTAKLPSCTPIYKPGSVDVYSLN